MAGWDQLFRYADTDTTPYSRLFTPPEDTKGRGFLTSPMSDRVVRGEDEDYLRDAGQASYATGFDWKREMWRLAEKQKKGVKLDATDRALLAIYDRQQREHERQMKENADRIDRERAMPRPVPYFDYDLPPPPPDGRWYGGPR